MCALVWAFKWILYFNQIQVKFKKKQTSDSICRCVPALVSSWRFNFSQNQVKLKKWICLCTCVHEFVFSSILNFYSNSSRTQEQTWVCLCTCALDWLRNFSQTQVKLKKWVWLCTYDLALVSSGKKKTEF